MGFEDDEKNRGARIRKLSKSIVEADLVNAVNGGVFDVALGFLPPGAVLVDAVPKIKLDTQFTGGGATSVGVTVGTAGAPTLIATNFDVLGGAASGLFVDMTRGAQRVVPAGGQQVVARFTPDAGHNLSALTAGACTIELYYSIPQT